MQVALWLVTIVGAIYFVTTQRMVDFFAVGFFSAAVYFLPGLVGYTLSPATPANPLKLPVQIDDEAYRIMLFVLSVIVVSGITWDRFRPVRLNRSYSIVGTEHAAPIAFVMGVAGLILTLIDTGGAVFAPDKRVVMEVVGRWHVIWQMGGTFGVLFAYAHRRSWLFFASMTLVMVDLYIGFRFAFAITFLSLLVLVFSQRPSVRILDFPLRSWLGIVLGGLFIISYQNLKEPIRTGDWAEVVDRVSNPEWYLVGVITSEPFTTQTVMNEIVARDFHASADSLWSATHHLILFAPALGAEATRFGDLFQPALFPIVDHGLANNIWAQMWSIGGWPLLVGFSVVFVAILALGSFLLSSRDSVLRVGVAIFFAYWAFYIHRNELLVQVGFQKQVALVWVSVVMLSMLIAGGIRESGHWRRGQVRPESYPAKRDSSS